MEREQSGHRCHCWWREAEKNGVIVLLRSTLLTGNNASSSLTADLECASVHGRVARWQSG